jgi:putative redox protein
MTDEIEPTYTKFNKVVVKQIEKKQSQVIIADHLSFIADEPKDLGGDSLGPNPFLLVLAALGQCTVGTLHDAARILDIPLEGVTVTLRYKPNLPGGVDPLAIDRTRNLAMSKITREIELKGPLSDEQKQSLLREADCCPVSNTLRQGVRRMEDVLV